jgi:thioredoxin 1
VYKVNVDKVRSLAVEYEIKSIPTVLIFKNGEEVKRFSGRRSKKEYINHLDDILKEGKP